MVETPWARSPEADGACPQGASAAPTSGKGPKVDIDFLRRKSIAELALEQGVGPVKDIGIFAGGIPEDEDVDQMLAEIYRLRQP